MKQGRPPRGSFDAARIRLLLDSDEQDRQRAGMVTCQLPPGSFDAARRRLLLDEQDRQRAGTVTCPACWAQMRVVDVAKREVSGSYCWGARLEGGRFSTQRQVVLPMLRAVEERAEVMCLVDVEGGMGAGQDHLEGVPLVDITRVIRAMAAGAGRQLRRRCEQLVNRLSPSAQHVPGSV